MSENKQEADRLCYEGRENYFDGNVDAAVEMYRRGLDLDPGRKERWNDLGSMLKDAERPSEAEPCYWKAIECDICYGDAWFNLGVVYLRRLGKPSNGLNCLLKAIQCSPDDAEAVSYAVEALSMLGRKEEAGCLLNFHPTSAQIPFVSQSAIFPDGMNKPVVSSKRDSASDEEVLNWLFAKADMEVVHLAESDGYTELARRLSVNSRQGHQ